MITYTDRINAADQQYTADDWMTASDEGDYNLAVEVATATPQAGNVLQKLLARAHSLNLAETSQWRALLHYKPTLGKRWKSQVDAPHFFLSKRGQNSPEAELDATLAAFFSSRAKAPLRLIAYCRFVARRDWIMAQLGELATLLPDKECPEYQRYVDYLQAHTLTLVFPTAHPNSPSSAFGHTLLRIDKKDQRAESRLLNMSINFAAEVPEEVSSTAYAINGLAGGFPGKFRLLPYHIKLREYGQIENRDTWEYPLKLEQAQVDLVLSHAYEMLISHFDYFFFSENCSYHLLSLLEVAFPDKPLTENFGLWTIPVDTIRILRERNLADAGVFVPSSIRTLKARQSALTKEDNTLSLKALNNGLDSIGPELDGMTDERQAAILDLLSDYERYRRLKSDRGAQSSSDTERSVLSRRSKLAVQSGQLTVPKPETPPDSGHGTSRLGLSYHYSRQRSNQTEISVRPAYHDFRDPSAAYDAKAAIQLGLVGIAYDHDEDEAFLRRLTIVSIESIEPRGSFIKPISWHTNLGWERPSPESRHEITFNVGAGVAYQRTLSSPKFFTFAESDLVDATAYSDRRQLRLGASAGLHWEPVKGIRFGLEMGARRQIGGDFHQSEAESWLALALGKNLSMNLDLSLIKTSDLETDRLASIGLRFYH